MFQTKLPGSCRAPLRMGPLPRLLPRSRGSPPRHPTRVALRLPRRGRDRPRRPSRARPAPPPPPPHPPHRPRPRHRLRSRGNSGLRRGLVPFLQSPHLRPDPPAAPRLAHRPRNRFRHLRRRRHDRRDSHRPPRLRRLPPVPLCDAHHPAREHLPSQRRLRFHRRRRSRPNPRPGPSPSLARVGHRRRTHPSHLPPPRLPNPAPSLPPHRPRTPRRMAHALRYPPASQKHPRDSRPGNPPGRKASLGMIRSLPVLVLDVAGRCNCRCAMCDIWKRDSTRFLRELPDLGRLGVQWAVLTGGEPLMHPDLFALCEKLHARRIRVTLLTTGLLLERFAAQIAAHIDDAIVSLDGPPPIHDQIRRIPGAFDRIRPAIAPDFPSPPAPPSSRSTAPVFRIPPPPRDLSPAAQYPISPSIPTPPPSIIHRKPTSPISNSPPP